MVCCEILWKCEIACTSFLKSCEMLCWVHCPSPSIQLTTSPLVHSDTGLRMYSPLAPDHTQKAPPTTINWSHMENDTEWVASQQLTTTSTTTSKKTSMIIATTSLPTNCCCMTCLCPSTLSSLQECSLAELKSANKTLSSEKSLSLRLATRPAWFFSMMLLDVTMYTIFDSSYHSNDFFLQQTFCSILFQHNPRSLMWSSFTPCNLHGLGNTHTTLPPS